MNGGKGSTILLTIIAVATLLVAVVGATFAYFSATMNGNSAATTIEVTSGTIAIEYDGSSAIKGGSLNPGATLGTRNFNVTGVVTGSSNLNYEANLIVKNNTYGDGELVYTITSTNSSNNGSPIVTTSDPVEIPKGASTISLGSGSFAGPITTGASHKYTINIMVKGDAVVDETSGKSFTAQLSVAQTKK